MRLKQTYMRSHGILSLYAREHFESRKGSSELVENHPKQNNRLSKCVKRETGSGDPSITAAGIYTGRVVSCLEFPLWTIARQAAARGARVGLAHVRITRNMHMRTHAQWQVSLRTGPG